MNEPSTTAEVALGGRLTVTSSQEAELVCVYATGELDLETAEEFEAALVDAQASAVERVVIDLSRLSFIDSTGLVVLLRAGRRAVHEGPRLEVRAGAGEVARMLHLTAIDQTLNVID